MVELDGWSQRCSAAANCLEFSARPWTDGDLLAIAYAWEQATLLRRPPTLVEQGLLAVTPARESRAGRSPARD